MEIAQAFFRAVEEHEGRFTAQLQTHTSELLEKVGASGENALEDITEEAEMLLMDKQALMELNNTTHENRLGALLKQEDQTRLREEAMFAQLTGQYREEESSRSRTRVLELQAFLEQNRRQIEAVMMRLGRGQIVAS